MINSHFECHFWGFLPISLDLAIKIFWKFTLWFCDFFILTWRCHQYNYFLEVEISFHSWQKKLQVLEVCPKNFTAPRNADGDFCIYLYKEMDLISDLFPHFYRGNCGGIQHKNVNLYIFIVWDVPQNAGFTHHGMLVYTLSKACKFWKNHDRMEFHSFFPKSMMSCEHVNTINMV